MSRAAPFRGAGKLTVPSIEASATEPGPAYVPRTGWPAWAVLPAGVAIFAGAALLAFITSFILSLIHI